MGLAPQQVSITSTWVAYPAATIEKALSAATRPALSQVELMNLYAGPDKKILYSQSSGLHVRDQCGNRIGG
ncbi:MAG: hypothetical protein U1G05_09515 [Kiritimatiellia bacterium]